MPAGIFNQRGVFLFLVFWIAPNFVWADHCTVSKIAIIAGTWENTNTNSSYTVQAQDGNGESCHVNQTLRLSFESTGGDNFTGQTGNPIQAWISSNSANRNFYYTHSVGEDYVLTVKAGYGTADSWEALFTATHNTANTPSQDTSATSLTTETATNTSTSQSSSSSATSAHYSAAPLSSLGQSTKYVVSAGRDRLGVVGSPLEFRAETNAGYGRNTIFNWNFGDGTEDGGAVASHTYEYPGVYVVVLKLALLGDDAVSRVNVKIIEPSLLITFASPERVEITNNSQYEISLFGRALVSGNKVFVFPRDTIVRSGTKLSFSSKVTGLSPFGLSDTSLAVVGTEVKLHEVVARTKEQKLAQIASIQTQISELRQKLTVAQRNARSADSAESRQVPTTVEELRKEPETSTTASEDALASVITSTQSKKATSWVQKLKRFFLRTE